MNKKIILIVFISSFLLTLGSVRAAVIILNESNKGNVGDSGISQAEPDYVFGDEDLMLVKSSSSDNMRIFSLWNLSVVPAGSTITNANLSIYLQWSPTVSRTLNAYNTTNVWSETTLTWNNKPAESILQSQTAGGTTDGVWLYWNVTDAAIARFASSDNPKNLSIEIRDNSEDSATEREHDFETKEFATVANRPKLVITYTTDSSAPTYSLNSTNSTLAGKPIEHRLKWTDDVGLSGYIFSFDNATGTFVNSSWTSMTGTVNWSNVTKTINSTAQKTIRWKVYANDSLDQWNVSDVYSYVITPTTPEYRNQGSNSSITIQGRPVLLYAQGKDIDGLSYATLSTNETGAWKNYTSLSMGNDIDWSWSNFTWQNTSFSMGVVAWKIFYNDSFNKQIVTATNTFSVESFLEINSLSIALNSTSFWWNQAGNASGLSLSNDLTPVYPGNVSLNYSSGNENKTLCSASINTQGAWSCVFLSPLSLGTYSVYARVVNGTTTFENTTTLDVKLLYGGTIPKSNMVTKKRFFLLQNLDGTVELVSVKLSIWKV